MANGLQVSVRRKAPSNNTLRDIKRNLDKFMETGVHPELERMRQVNTSIHIPRLVLCNELRALGCVSAVREGVRGHASQLSIILKGRNAPSQLQQAMEIHCPSCIPYTFAHIIFHLLLIPSFRPFPSNLCKEHANQLPALPDLDIHRPFVFMDIAVGGKPLGRYPG